MQLYLSGTPITHGVPNESIVQLENKRQNPIILLLNNLDLTSVRVELNFDINFLNEDKLFLLKNKFINSNLDNIKDISIIFYYRKYPNFSL